MLIACGLCWQDEALRTSSLLSADLFLALATYTSSLPNNLPGVTAQLFNFGGALVEVVFYQCMT